MKPTFGSLFAGVGGFDMGFEQAGYECQFQVEWDKHCQQILARHWPDVPRWSDVQDVDGTTLPPCDVLIFGSPCQDLSVAGKRAGLEGERSGLFHEATRIIKEMKHATGNIYPRVVVWENVPGALNSNRGEDFRAVLNEMAECGSHLTEWAVLDAQHFGVPQRRRRIFLVAVLDPSIVHRCPDPLFPVAAGRRGDYAKSIPQRQNPTPFTTDSPRTPSPNSNHPTDLVSALTTRRGSTFDDQQINQLVIPFATNQRAEVRELGDISVSLSAERGTNQQTYIAESIIPFENSYRDGIRIGTDLFQTLSAKMGTGGNNTPMITQPIHSFDTQFGSNAAVFTDTSPTLKASQQSPSIQTEYAVRRLTPIECERLMGWPDDHTRWTADGREQADTHRYKQCGNGVATPVAKWIANQIGTIL